MNLIFDSLESSSIKPSLTQAKIMQQLDLKFFEQFILTRLNEDIPPHLMLNIVRNIICYDNFQELQLALNNIIVTSYLANKKYEEHFLYLLKYDKRKISNICSTTMWHLQFLNRSDAIKHINYIVEKTNIDYYYLLIKLMESYEEAPNIKIALFLDDFELEQRYRILISALKYNSDKVFFPLITNMDDCGFSDLIKSKLYQEGDSNYFASLLRDTSICIEPRASQTHMSHLINILHSVQERIPNTINALFQKSKEKKYWNFIMHLAVCLPKKEVLKAILQSDNQILIETFYKKYANDPAIRGLMPFI
jgi:hypothetical protein